MLEASKQHSPPQQKPTSYNGGGRKGNEGHNRATKYIPKEINAISLKTGKEAVKAFVKDQRVDQKR